MISLIVCSRTNSISQILLDNIEATIGVPYELVIIDNSTNRYNICEAYNLGVARSKFGILCFMHDDITYHSHNWGQAVQTHLDTRQFGLIGIAGTPYLSFMPGTWWGSGKIYQNLLQSPKPGEAAILKTNVAASEFKEVVAVDGVWFCVKKELFDTVRFDDINFKAFHCYDVDLCMQLQSLGIKRYCIGDVLLSHNSMGALNSSWIENALIFQKKWQHSLPASTEQFGLNQSCILEYKALNEFILICSANRWQNGKIYKMALSYLFKFKRGYLFYKTPGYLVKFIYKALFKKGAPFYTL